MSLSGLWTLARFRYWVPVVAIVVALFAAPGSSTGAGTASLAVTPGAGSYGGQSVTFSGDMGVRGVQVIRIERRGSPTGTWGDLPDPRTGKAFTTTTAADGTFRFTFPAPAMNGIYFRVASKYAHTPAHQFLVNHQDADISVEEISPADIPLPRGIAAQDESFWIAVDTANGITGKRPVLQGRTVTLERRDGSDTWQTVTTGALDAAGAVRFGRYGPGGAAPVPGVYRVVLGDWTADGDRVGWFPSLPLYLSVVARPAPVTGLAAAATTSAVKLSWQLPADARRDKIVIARTVGSQAEPPTASLSRQVVATLAGSATGFTDTHLISNIRTYKYAVYTRSADGVYSRLTSAQYVTATTPSQRGEG